MRIYYNPNDNIECPFISNGKSVGSKACKNCKYCYGKDFSKFTNYTMIIKDKEIFINSESIVKWRRFDISSIIE